MAKRYARLNWQNTPSVATPMNATNLNKMDKGIDDLDNAIENLYNVKIDKSSTANNLVTTEAGLVLDARQGKVLKDGVDELNKNIGFIRYMDLISTTEEINKPYEFIQNIWDALPLNSIIIASVSNGARSVAIIQKYNRHEYGSMIIWGYGLANPIYGRIADGVWQDAVNL